MDSALAPPLEQEQRRLPGTLEEMLAADPLALARERQLRLRGTVLSRRVLSRSLAFCTLGRLEAHAGPGRSWSEGPPSRQSLVARGWVPPGPCAGGDAGEEQGASTSACSTLALCFASALVDTCGEHAAEEEGPEHRPGPRTDDAGGAAGPWAPFPGRRGDLAVGTRVEVSLLVAPEYRRSEPLVRRWRILGAASADTTGLPPDAAVPSGAPPPPGLPLGFSMAEHHARRDAVNRAALAELRAGRSELALCKFWSMGTSGSGDAASSQVAKAAGCQEGDACCFRHHFLDSAEAALAQRRLAARVRSQAAAAAELGAYEDVGDPPHGGVKVDKRRRAWSFASWLLGQYGKDALCQGEGVLDVAGGQGDLSWVLSVESGVPCTLVDPGLRRGGALKSWQRRALRKSGRECFAHVPVEFGVQNFGPWEVGGPGRADERPPYAPLLSGASLVVGLHPDEATEAIVDLSLASLRRFAVVPCCVHAHKFPGRELPSGEPVRSLNQFCAYLRAKDARIQEALLDFEGRNKVLFLP